MGTDPTRGSGREVFKMSRLGSGQEVFKSSRVWSGRVKRCSNLAGRVRSGQDFFDSHWSGRIGSGRFFFKPHGSDQVESKSDKKLTGRVNRSLAGRASTTCELFSANPRVGPVHSAREPDTSKTSSFLPKGFSGTNTE